MKASEMTNEELAKWLERFCESMDAFNVATANIRKAVARLLWQDIDNAKLRRRLKVAEGALKECRGLAERYEVDDDYMMSDICSDIRGIVRTTLAAIREEGGAE